MTIIVQMVSQMSEQSINLINKYPFGMRLSYRLTELILMSLSEETEGTVYCTLQLCYHLLTKARSIYLPLMHRNGIIKMIRTMHSLLQLPGFRFIGKIDGCYHYPVNRSCPDYNDDSFSDDGSVLRIPRTNKPKEEAGEGDASDSETSSTVRSEANGNVEREDPTQRMETVSSNRFAFFLLSDYCNYKFYCYCELAPF